MSDLIKLFTAKFTLSLNKLACSTLTNFCNPSPILTAFTIKIRAMIIYISSQIIAAKKFYEMFTDFEMASSQFLFWSFFDKINLKIGSGAESITTNQFLCNLWIVSISWSFCPWRAYTA
jgi:hypothetical protein